MHLGRGVRLLGFVILEETTHARFFLNNCSWEGSSRMTKNAELTYVGVTVYSRLVLSFWKKLSVSGFFLNNCSWEGSFRMTKNVELTFILHD